MQKAVLFKGTYATLDLFTDEIYKELKKQGFNVLIFDVNNFQQSLMKFAQFAQTPIAFALSYNNLGFNMELVPGHNMWDQLGIKFINILMDHPFHYHKALIDAPKDCIVFTCDRNHVEYIKRFYPNIAQTYYLPHGAAYTDCGKEWDQRSIDVLYAGGLSSDLVDGLKPDVSKYTDFDANDLVNCVTDTLIRNPSMTTENAIEQYLSDIGLLYQDDKLREIISDFRIVESYAVSYFREKVIETLVNAGINVTVYGNGWTKREVINNPHMKYGGLISPSDVLEKMKESKIVLNTMTWFKDGSHDRVFHGMLAGAVCVTDYSKYISEVVKNGYNGFVFELDKLGDMTKLIRDILAGNADVEKIIENGRKTGIKEHLFDSRVEIILKYLKN